MTSRRDALVARERALAEEETSLRHDRDKLSEDARKLLDRQKDMISKGVATPRTEAEGEATASLSEDEMFCPGCRTVISKDAIMCYACGQKIRDEDMGGSEKAEEQAASDEEIPCPNCKTMVSKDALMCYACGVNIKDALEKLETKVESGDTEKQGGFRRPQIFVKKIVKKKAT